MDWRRRGPRRGAQACSTSRLPRLPVYPLLSRAALPVPPWARSHQRSLPRRRPSSRTCPLLLGRGLRRGQAALRPRRSRLRRVRLQPGPRCRPPRCRPLPCRPLPCRLRRLKPPQCKDIRRDCLQMQRTSHLLRPPPRVLLLASHHLPKWYGRHPVAFQRLYPPRNSIRTRQRQPSLRQPPPLRRAGIHRRRHRKAISTEARLLLPQTGTRRRPLRLDSRLPTTPRLRTPPLPHPSYLINRGHLVLSRTLRQRPIGPALSPSR